MLEKAQPSLEEVEKQFEEWRRHRGRREKIPPALWEAAASLSGQYSVYQISKRLRLHYRTLKNRVGAECPASAGSEKEEAIIGPKGSAFIELDMISPRAASEYLIEMEKPGGAKMKISFKGGCPDMMGLSQAFWREA